MIPKIEIIGDVEKIAQYIPWAKKQWVLREGLWYKDLKECLIEFKNISNSGYIRIFVKAVTGFVGHPRTGSVKQLPFWNNDMEQKYLTGIDGGGYFEKNGAWVEIDNRTPYPLEDDDLGTFLLEKEVEWLGDTDNYGNCWWTDGESTLSWKSNPNWQFPLDSSLNIPCLSRPENKVGDKLYYTCFSNNIYAEGDILTVGPVTPPVFGSNVIEPSLIAGAWYLGGALLCCSVINKADTVGGYWLGIYKQDGEEWKLVGSEFPTSRLHTPAFISKDGKTVIQGTKKYTINADITGVIQSDLMTIENTGTRIITGAGGYGSTYKYTSSAEYWAGINKADEPEISLVSTKADFGYSSVGNTTTQTKMVPVYRGNPATSIVIQPSSFGCDSCTGNLYFEAVVNGAYCSITWAGVDCFKDKFATKQQNPCDGYSVTAIVNPQGLSYTYTQAAISGALVLSGSLTPLGGESYTLSGTPIAPVTWTISKGTISSSGVIGSTTGLCGTATITATDACGRSASLDVAMPIGVWIFSHRYQKTTSCAGQTGNLGEKAVAYYMHGGYAAGPIYEGGYKKIGRFGGLYPNGVGGGSCPHNGWFPSDWCLAARDSYGGSLGDTSAFTRYSIAPLDYGGSQWFCYEDSYVWSCP